MFTVEKSNTLFFQLGILLERTPKGVVGSEAAIFIYHAVAGSLLPVGIGVESLADAAGVTGAKSHRQLAVGGNVTLGYLLNERINRSEEIHEYNYTHELEASVGKY